jgi:2-oxoisovalerate dehydrogenase E2 component (dihydrolipoyl transacylase)
MVAVGDKVTPDSVLAEVLTDKATVEVSSPTTGVVTALHGAPGDVLAVGSDLVEIETGDASGPPVAPTPASSVTPAAPRPPSASRGRALAAPAVRARAEELGIDLAAVRGSGPDGRVVHADLDAATGTSGSTTSHTEPVRGIRRRIAERLTAAWTEIPHITYVDAVDVTALEQLRAELNKEDGGGVRLTTLPFIVRAMAIACGEQPRLNAHYNYAEQILTTFAAVDVGIATQPDSGLLVPVVRSVETRSIRGVATEIARVTTAARDSKATQQELTGSTITITSLGALGGLVTTPIINAPEVAIVGVNKIEMRPVWRGGRFEPRQMMNLSSSFDHRMVDGWDAATFVQRIKSLLETPALLFVDDR